MADATTTNHLRIPEASKALYASNFIKRAVCELRFPTLFDLVENSVPPASLAKALRKEFPFHNYSTSLSVENPAAPTPIRQHDFRSKNQRWSATLRASSLIIETSNYTSYDDFRARIDAVVRAAQPVLDTDFFTRIGLRFINALPYELDRLDQWLNKDLASPVSSGVLGTPQEFYGRVRGTTPEGGYLVQHGMGFTDQGDGKTLTSLYTLDIDIYADDVNVSDALSKVDALHNIEFSLFSWCLGPAAKDKLGPNKLERGRK